MNRARLFGLMLTLAGFIMLWITTRVPGYELQILSAALAVLFALAAVVTLFRSLDGIAGGR